MANLNRVFLIGRLTRDPESRSTQSGNAVVAFGLAVNRTYTRQSSGEKVEETCFVDVEAWGRTGETIARYMRKGRQIFIEGRLKFDSWEKEGQRHSKLRVVVEGFQFLDSGQGGEGGRGRDAEGDERASVGASYGGASYGANRPSAGEGAPPDDFGAAGDDIPF